MPDVCSFHSGVEKDFIKIYEILDERKDQTDMRFDSIERHRLEIKELMEHRLAVMNDLQRRMDEMTRIFAIKKSVEDLEKMVHVGLGIAMTLHFILGIAIVIVAKWT